MDMLGSSGLHVQHPTNKHYVLVKMYWMDGRMGHLQWRLLKGLHISVSAVHLGYYCSFFVIHSMNITSWIKQVHRWHSILCSIFMTDTMVLAFVIGLIMIIIIIIIIIVVVLLNSIIKRSSASFKWNGIGWFRLFKSMKVWCLNCYGYR